MWQILTEQIKEEIYCLLVIRELFPEEQNRCRKGTRGTAELLYIDQHIPKDSKTRWKNVARRGLITKRLWYDPSKLDNTLSQNVQDIRRIIKLNEETMENWRVELSAGGKSLAKVKIQRGIFQGYALLPLIFVTVMIPLNHLLWKCTGGYTLTK